VAVNNQKIGLSYVAFFSNLRQMVDLADVLGGLFKSLVFAVIIGTVACHQGLITIGGPRGIGRSVTKSVVNCIVLILILDYFLTRLLIFLER
jgi:phospholipid/cholesterol/gamma-HCH transport system permease protein